MFKRFRILPMLLLPALALTIQPVVSAAPLAQTAQPIYNKSGNCINYKTSLPSVSGVGFRVFSPKSASSAAKAVANVIRSHDVFGVYERGLGVGSLNQSGQTGKFPVFVDPGLVAQIGSADGVTASLCQHPNWEAVDIYPNLGPDELAATTYHELFHAAQAAVLQNARFHDNWWYEATATASEAWFGSKQHKEYDPDVIEHPGAPMDQFDNQKGSSAHQYAAYLFVQWALQSAVMPTSSQWDFLKKSITSTYASKPNWDAGLDKALPDLPTPSPCDKGIPPIACDVASFWGDEIRPKPTYAKTATMKTIPIDPDETAFTLPAAGLYAALAVALKPASDQNQIKLTVPTLPDGVEVWIYMGKGKVENVKPGERFSKVFCRSGQINDSVPLPETGNIRIAMTTTRKDAAHKDIDFKTETSTVQCNPSNGIIVLGSNNAIVADFTSLNCKLTTSGNVKDFTATGKNGAYSVRMWINHFTGYKDYWLQFESSNPGFVIKGPGGPYSNLYWPGGTPPDNGGEITFPTKGLVGLGFIEAFNQDGSGGVAVAGTAPCHLASS